jgi:hypothetical protein
LIFHDFFVYSKPKQLISKEENMKNIFIVMVIIGLLISSISCSSQPANDSSQDVILDSPQEEVEEVEPVATAKPLPTPTEEAPAWQASSPIAQFTDEDIEYLGIQCTGDDAEIAECIKEWQVDNILYCVSPSGDDISPTCSALVETNEMLPGILTSKDVIYNQLYEGRINGLCMDYAATYCSIAEYYGIQCRMLRTNYKYCEVEDCDEEDANPSWDEMTYAFFIKPLLDKNDLPYTLEAINSVAEDTWAHYWAEVFIDGEWKFMETRRPEDTAKLYTQNKFVVIDWEEMDKSDEMDAFLN